MSDEPIYECLSDHLRWKESEMIRAPKFPGEPERLWCPECGGDDVFLVDEPPAPEGPSK